MLGLVQAGNPVEVFEHTSKEIPFVAPESHNASGNKYFALAVKGYSMMDAGILPGDKLLIEFGAQPRNGQIVVASVESHEITVKRYAMKGSLLYKEALQKGNPELENKDVIPINLANPPALLVPENSDFQAIPFGLHQQDRIIGVVRSLYRSAVE